MILDWPDDKLALDYLYTVKFITVSVVLKWSNEQTILMIDMKAE